MQLNSSWCFLNCSCSFCEFNFEIVRRLQPGALRWIDCNDLKCVPKSQIYRFVENRQARSYLMWRIQLSSADSIPKAKTSQFSSYLGTWFCFLRKTLQTRRSEVWEFPKFDVVFVRGKKVWFEENWRDLTDLIQFIKQEFLINYIFSGWGSSPATRNETILRIIHLPRGTYTVWDGFRTTTTWISIPISISNFLLLSCVPKVLKKEIMDKWEIRKLSYVLS